MSQIPILDPFDSGYNKAIALLFLREVKSKGINVPENFDSESEDYETGLVVKFNF